MKMKKYLFASLVCLGLINSAWANPISLGLTSGIDFASQSIIGLQPGITQNVLVGYTGGLFVDLNLSDNFSIQPEANFTMKGTGFTISNIDGIAVNTTQTQTFNYLEFPLLVKLRLPLAPELKVFLLAGPSVALLLQEVTSLASGGSSHSADSTKYYPST